MVSVTAEQMWAFRWAVKTWSRYGDPFWWPFAYPAPGLASLHAADRAFGLIGCGLAGAHGRSRLRDAVRRMALRMDRADYLQRMEVSA